MSAKGVWQGANPHPVKGGAKAQQAKIKKQNQNKSLIEVMKSIF